MIELGFKLEVNPRFVDRCVAQQGFVEITVCGEYLVTPVLGEKHLDGERLIDACGFNRDVGKRRTLRPAIVESLKCLNDEVGWLVLNRN
ncbi:hypothetical protein ABNG03_05755 [Halorubrum sp. RMP-47]|uniref:hypothetical protein n=1 Tax=Halorubrum miltondacostae TaxID=3076378 RepID=UPI00352871A2